VLALPDARSVAIIGAGVQARSQLAALRMMREITSVQVFDSSLEAAQRLGAAQRFALDPTCSSLSMVVADSVDGALSDAHIAITSTWARQPFLFRRQLHPGLHITTLEARTSRESVKLRPRFLPQHWEKSLPASIQAARHQNRSQSLGAWASRFKTWPRVGSLMTQPWSCN